MKTKIDWCDSVWNPVTGCSKVSEGCRNCYAERMATRLAGRCGYPQDNPFAVTLHMDKMGLPINWKKPRLIFVNSMGDLFHPDVPDDTIDTVFAVMALTHHTFIILTKRPERLKHYMTQDEGFGRWGYIDGRARQIWAGLERRSFPKGKVLLGPLPNVWLGVSVEDQASADDRVPKLLATPAAKRLVSVEPMLGPVDLRGYLPSLDWVICGGESGPKARPLYTDWARSLRDQCHSAGVPFWFKGWGEWITKSETGYITNGLPWGTLDRNGGWFPETTPWNGRQGVFSETGEVVMVRVGKKRAGHLLDGAEYREMPK